ncbi:MAG: DNA internalization-related competence protein ComEC/Rec2 [Ignavibacteriales bacterium]|nr:MAG: DNA internalization-related competence protein ComEC/Rec2 [Ignavibacteriales bacterium]
MRGYPVILFTASLIIGIIFTVFVNPFIDAFLPAAIVIIVVAILFLILKLKSTLNSQKLKVLSIVLIGFIAGSILALEKDSVKTLNIHREKNVKVTGKITSVELKRERSIQFMVECDSLQVNDNTFFTGLNLICRIYDTELKKLDSIYNKIYPGNIIELSGTFSSGRERRNPGEFDFRKYLESKDISGVITLTTTDDLKILGDEYDFFKSTIHDIRTSIDSRISELHDRKTSGLLRGLLLADRTEINAEVKNDFIDSGVVHILAVSGLHVGYILMIFILLTGRFNIKIRMLMTIAGILSFLLITNSPPSVFRACVMAIVFILAKLTGRSSNIYNSLAIAAAIILLFDYKELFNPGFQLSFSAVLAIAVFVPLLTRVVNSGFIKSGILKNILILSIVSFAAQIGTLSLTLMYFGKISLIGLMANLIVIPLAGVIIAIGILTLCISPLSFLIASLSAETNMLLTSMMLELVRFSSNLSFAFTPVKNFSMIDVLVFYVHCIFIICFIKRFTNNISKIVFVILVAANIFIFTSFDNEEVLVPGNLNVMVIDVGQGDAILIKFPNGETALVDAGDANYFFDAGERIIIPLLDYLGINKIDYAFISHLDSDHYAGFVSLIYNNRIKKVFKPQTDSSSNKDLRFEAYLKKMQIPFEDYSTGVREFGSAKIYFLTSQYVNNAGFSHNNKSGVFKLVYGDSEILFTGDIELAAETYYANKYKTFLQSDVLKVAHHGSETSSTPSFISYVKPEISLISAGVQNKFNHPSDIVLQSLDDYSRILRTDKSGAIILSSDGREFSLIEWKNF